MSKVKSAWFCNECGQKEPKWTGQCPSCKNWNTFAEEIVEAVTKRFEAQRAPSKPMRLDEVDLSGTPRIKTSFEEFNRLTGGGIVPGSLSLVGGEPGIGKSTLLLQLTDGLDLTILYVCGEESVEQTASRAKRLGVSSKNILFLNETDYGLIQQHIDRVSPDVVVIDSIQIVYKRELSSSPGSVTQVRETATECMHLAKGRGITIFLVGHVTKSGEIAGPRVLEHLVDTVLYFEGDRQQNYRMMRAVKNRFGPTDEIAVFQMGQEGLTEVPNPSEIFLQDRSPGSVIIPTIEGTRPILVEAQALVTPTAYSTPSRRSTGMNPNRLQLLLAVLDKRLKFRLHTADVFVSIAGGLTINEPSVDLGILLAVASSHGNAQVPAHTVVIGEVGLGGEIRAVPRIDARIKEAARMGFTHAIVPKRNAKGISTTDIHITPVDTVEEAVRHALRRSS